MGYEYTIRGWYRCKSAVDLTSIHFPTSDEFGPPECNLLENSVHVTGRRNDYIVFATEAKHRIDYYLKSLAAIIAGSGGSGTGLITVTGEWKYDGKDHFIIIRDDQFFLLPILRIYDPLSPWNALYGWAHYMTRRDHQLRRTDEVLQQLGREVVSVKGFLNLPVGTSMSDLAEARQDLARGDPTLRGGVSSMNLYSEPYVLIGQDQLATASALAALANWTAAHDASFGTIYCAGPDECTQIPIGLEGGGVCVLPELNLWSETDLLPLCPSSHLYQGLGSAFQAIPIRSTSELPQLQCELEGATGARALEPGKGRREHTGVSGPAYLSCARQLGLILTANEGQVRHVSDAEWAWLLIVYANGAPEPKDLQSRTRELIRDLQGHGMDVGVRLVWPK